MSMIPVRISICTRPQGMRMPFYRIYKEEFGLPMDVKCVRSWSLTKYIDNHSMQQFINAGDDESTKDLIMAISDSLFRGTGANFWSIIERQDILGILYFEDHFDFIAVNNEMLGRSPSFPAIGDCFRNAFNTPCNSVKESFERGLFGTIFQNSTVYIKTKGPMGLCNHISVNEFEGSTAVTIQVLVERYYEYVFHVQECNMKPYISKSFKEHKDYLIELIWSMYGDNGKISRVRQEMLDLLIYTSGKMHQAKVTPPRIRSELRMRYINWIKWVEQTKIEGHNVVLKNDTLDLAALDVLTHKSYGQWRKSEYLLPVSKKEHRTKLKYDEIREHKEEPKNTSFFSDFVKKETKTDFMKLVESHKPGDIKHFHSMISQYIIENGPVFRVTEGNILPAKELSKIPKLQNVWYNEESMRENLKVKVNETSNFTIIVELLNVEFAKYVDFKIRPRPEIVPDRWNFGLISKEAYTLHHDVPLSSQENEALKTKYNDIEYTKSKYGDEFIRKYYIVKHKSRKVNNSLISEKIKLFDNKFIPIYLDEQTDDSISRRSENILEANNKMVYERWKNKPKSERKGKYTRDIVYKSASDLIIDSVQSALDTTNVYQSVDLKNARHMMVRGFIEKSDMPQVPSRLREHILQLLYTCFWIEYKSYNANHHSFLFPGVIINL